MIMINYYKNDFMSIIDFYHNYIDIINIIIYQNHIDSIKYLIFFFKIKMIENVGG